MWKFMQAQIKQYSLLVFAFLSFLINSARSQTHLRLILHTDKAMDSVLVVHWTDKEATWLPYKDTLYVNFKTRGIDFYHLNYKTGNNKIYYAPLFLDTGRITITSHIEIDKLIIDSVTGSLIYEKYARWKADFNQLKMSHDTSAIDSFLLRTYAENIDNLFSFNIGSRYVDLHQNDKSKLYALFPLIAKQAKETKEQFGFTLFNDRLLGIIGNDLVRLSDYPLINIRNQTTHAKALNSKFVILDFWFVGCIPCMEDHQKIINLLPEFRQKQVELISISNDNSYIRWKTYLEKNKFSWQHYKKNTNGKDIIGHLGITTYPTYILLDEKGKIMYMTFSLEELLDQLNQ